MYKIYAKTSVGWICLVQFDKPFDAVYFVGKCTKYYDDIRVTDEHENIVYRIQRGSIVLDELTCRL